MSVVFDFNASPNDVAPVPLKNVAVDLMRIEKRIVDRCHLCCFFCFLPLRSSFVSVVFDFNASLKVVAPVPLILFPADFMRIEKELIVDRCHLCVASFVLTTQI